MLGVVPHHPMFWRRGCCKLCMMHRLMQLMTLLLGVKMHHSSARASLACSTVLSVTDDDLIPSQTHKTSLSDHHISKHSLSGFPPYSQLVQQQHKTPSSCTPPR